MRHRMLGRTGISVSELGLGAMMLGPFGGNDQETSARIVHAALDAGVNLVDTADVYSLGESERIVGAAIKGRRDDVVLATKFGLPMGEDPNHRGGSRRWIVRAVEDSLRRLGTDHIDLYQMHRPDPATDLSETLGALTDLVRAGKIRAFGSSMFAADAIVEGQWAAERAGTHAFASEQLMYSIFTRRPEAAVFPAIQRYQMGALVFGPLNSGWLSGRADIAGGHRAAGQPAHFDPESVTGRVKAAALPQLRLIAQEAGLTLPQLAIGFAAAHPAVTSVLLGPRTAGQLDGALSGAGVELPGDVLDRIDAIVAPGTDVNPADNYGTTPPALADKNLRRRGGL
ncbi:aldo/keto reductase [Dactylosporangium sp. CS-047395]|uniref:aldo/keto reductase n=1 Tax=Dactylosporangium sp. CS-047395 TaxID=3239936 RepID=UPI003D93C234